MRKFNVYLNNNFLFYQLFGIEPTTADLSSPVEVEARTVNDVFRICNSDEIVGHLIPRSLSVGDVIQIANKPGYVFLIEKRGILPTHKKSCNW